MNDDFSKIIEQVKQLDTRMVAEWVNIHPVQRGRKKYPCPMCGSSDNLNINVKYGAGARCYSPGCAPPQGVTWSNVDLVMVTQDLQFKEAVDWLAVRAGIKAGEVITKASTLYVAREIERVPKSDVRHLWDQLYRGLSLGPIATQYLNSRGIVTEMANAMGLVSIENVHQWQKAVRGLGDENARRCGLMSERGGVCPWHQKPALVIPYVDSEKRLDLLRFRCLDPSEQRFRYLSPSGFHADYPYLVRAVDACINEGKPLHVTEGEIDALSMVSKWHYAVSSCGAGSWRDEWVERWSQITQGVVIVADGDGADGINFAKRVMASCVRVHGAMWTRGYVKVVACPPQYKDANELLKGGLLDQMMSGAAVAVPFEQEAVKYG